MTDQSSTLTPAAMRQIISHIDSALAVLDRYRGKATVQQLQMKSMLLAVRGQLEEQLHNGSGDASRPTT